MAQYNILASYLGDNRLPWFLYGIELPTERREAVMARFYERDEAGSYKHAGWPSYVTGLLSETEQAAVLQADARFFSWELRRGRILRVIAGLDADLLSMVELDQFDTTFKPALEARGYASVYKKRPRAVSCDGCGIFWKTSRFRLVASDALEFVDGVDATGAAVKDRVGLMVLLEHVSGAKLIFVSTHLARNPEDEHQTTRRVRQAAQLFQRLTEFAARHDAMAHPVMLAGDLNTTNIRQVLHPPLPRAPQPPISTPT